MYFRLYSWGTPAPIFPPRGEMREGENDPSVKGLMITSSDWLAKSVAASAEELAGIWDAGKCWESSTRCIMEM